MFLRFASLCGLVYLLAVSAPAQTKRPLNHHDYDGWRAIAGQHLSPDGKFLAYAVFPEEGDGEVIVRSLVTGKETRYPAGARPAPATASEEAPAAEARGATILFSSDSRTVVFSTFPAKADTDKAKKDKKPAGQMPKDGMVIVDLASRTGHTRGAREAIRDARKCRWLPGVSARGSRGIRRRRNGRRHAAMAIADQQGGRGGRGGAGGGAGRGARPEFGTDLVLRNLGDSTERSFPDVVEFSFTERWQAAGLRRLGARQF